MLMENIEMLQRTLDNAVRGAAKLLGRIRELEAERNALKAESRCETPNGQRC